MLYFPQLSTGSLGQYPLVRYWSRPTTTSALPDGSTLSMVTPAPPRMSWELRFNGLSPTEWGALQTLFHASQGRFGTFTFVDPTDNALCWSEDFTQSAWTADPLLTISLGAGDPGGGTAAVRLTNGGQSAQHVSQSLAVPSSYQFCFSAFLQADSPTSVALIRSSATSQAKQTFGIGSNWIRAVSTGSLGGQDASVSFAIEIAAGASVCIFGPQVEAQPSAGPYKRKLDRSGVYSKSRFDQDVLIQTTDTFGQYSTTVRITASY